MREDRRLRGASDENWLDRRGGGTLGSLTPLTSRSEMNLSNQEFKGPIRLHHSQLKSMLNKRKLLRSKWIVMHSK